MIPMFTLPETLPSRVLTNKARRIRALKIPGYENVQSPDEAAGKNLKNIFKVALVRPWIILFDIIALLCAIYLAIVYALLYMLFTIYPIVFQQHRGWNSGVGELPLIGTMLGAFVAGGIVFYESSRGKKKMDAGIERTPEDRMPLAMLGGILFPITMFWFAWSANFNSVPWIVPTLAGMFLATSIVLIFVAYLNYLTDSYLIYAASAVAGNTIMRSALGAVAPLWTEQMFSALGVGGAGSLIGGVACLLAIIPFMFYKYGARIRQRSNFTPTGEKKARDGAGGNAAATEQSRETANADISSDDEAGHGVDRAGDSSHEKDMEGQISQTTSHSKAGDPYLDADGLEKAEQ